MPEHPLVPALRLFEADMRGIRHDIHRHPETGYAEHRTAALVARCLRGWGLEVAQGIAGTGVVGTLRGRRAGSRAVGLRADMDALHIREIEGRPYGSIVPGKMHACGHDGHTATLLGAARYLAADPDFAGSVHFVFQPAEEGLGGAPRMVREGLFQRFPMDAIYGLHNWPGLPAGEFHTRTGPFMAACQLWTVTFNGRGGHAGASSGAMGDLVLPMAQFILGLESVVGRNVAATDAAVIGVGPVVAGEIGSANVIPSEVVVRGTTRSYDDAVHDVLVRRLTELAEAQAQAFGCEVEVVHHDRTPVLETHVEQTSLSVRAATMLVGAERVHVDAPKSMAGEDFADLLRACPGGFMFLGAGSGEDGLVAALHTPGYDFNDDLLCLGAAYWVQLVHAELGGD